MSGSSQLPAVGTPTVFGGSASAGPDDRLTTVAEVAAVVGNRSTEGSGNGSTHTVAGMQRAFMHAFGEMSAAAAAAESRPQPTPYPNLETELRAALDTVRCENLHFRARLEHNTTWITGLQMTVEQQLAANAELKEAIAEKSELIAGLQLDLNNARVLLKEAAGEGDELKECLVTSQGLQLDLHNARVLLTEASDEGDELQVADSGTDSRHPHLALDAMHQPQPPPFANLESALTAKVAELETECLERAPWMIATNKRMNAAIAGLQQARDKVLQQSEWIDGLRLDNSELRENLTDSEVGRDTLYVRLNEMTVMLDQRDATIEALTKELKFVKELNSRLGAQQVKHM